MKFLYVANTNTHTKLFKHNYIIVIIINVLFQFKKIENEKEVLFCNQNKRNI
jgi:hypothetical protein